MVKLEESLLLFVIIGGFSLCSCDYLIKEPPSQEGTVWKVINALSQGKAEGLVKRTPNGNLYASFEGISYAQPPVGDLRFKDPIPLQRWTDDTRDATKPGSICVQRMDDDIVGSEDCLFLNVYAPFVEEKSSKKVYTVMIYIHGGGYLIGSSLVAIPELFIDEEVVLVSLNYRLGPLGFLDLGTKDVSGSAGMKDQVLALKWVRDNIGEFGGDVKNVALFGESAGGTSVLLHQISPLSKGLFHKVISISGSSLCEWAVQEESQKISSNLQKILRGNLWELEAYDVYEAGEKVDGLVAGDFGNYPWRPAIDRSNSAAFLTKSPREYYSGCDFANIPTMMSYASQEFAPDYNRSVILDYFNNPRWFLPREWLLRANNDTVHAAIDRIMKFYFGKEGFDLSNRENLMSALDLSSDLGFVKPVTDLADILSRKNKEEVFLYRFSYRGGLNHRSIDLFGLQGATHGDELFYIFPNETPRVNETSSDGWTRSRLMKTYTNFAKFGNPNSKMRDHLLPVIWKAVEPDCLHYLDIGGELVPSKNPDFDRVLFWRELERFVLKN